MAPDILDKQERAAFLEWRRDLARYGHTSVYILSFVGLLLCWLPRCDIGKPTQTATPHLFERRCWAWRVNHLYGGKGELTAACLLSFWP